MGTVVVLGNETLGSEALHEFVTTRTAAGHRVHLVVPASPQRAEARGLHSEHLRWHAEHPDVSAARWRMQRALEAWRAEGMEVTGEVGAPDPVRALQDALTRVTADEVVVSSLPRRLSRWLARDVPRRVERAVDVPVVVVEQADDRPSAPAAG